MVLLLSTSAFFFLLTPKKKNNNNNKKIYMANPALPWSQFNASRMVLLRTSFIPQKTCLQVF